MGWLTHCSFCGELTRDACSDYKRRYQAEEIRKCPYRREYTLGAAGLETDADRALRELQEENSELKRRLGK